MFSLEESLRKKGTETIFDQKLDYLVLQDGSHNFRWLSST